MDRSTILRNQAARPTLARIKLDCERVGPQVRGFLEIIEKRLFKDSLNVEDLWRQAETKDRNASAQFTKELGITPALYIGHSRLEVAARMMVDTKLSLAAISKEVGFSYRNVLSRKFKDWTGITPTQFKSKPNMELLSPRPSPHLAEARTSLSAILEQVEQEDFAAALDHMVDAETVVRRLDIPGSARLLAVDCHKEGSYLTDAGNVDRAYFFMDFARQCYELAGELPENLQRRRQQIRMDCQTDLALSAALCTTCRKSFLSEVGSSVRQHLRRSLALIPRDLVWFEACCDDCYRTVWDAITRARFGLIDDAFQAWWISENVDLTSTTPSSGLFIRLLSESEDLTFGDANNRLSLCKTALGVAENLGRHDLSKLALAFTGNAQRVLTQFSQARITLTTTDSSHFSQWANAYLLRARGLLEVDMMDIQPAEQMLAQSEELFHAVDPHVSALVRFDRARAIKWSTGFDEALSVFESAVSAVDSRRWHLSADIIRINRGLFQTAAGLLDEAEETFREEPGIPTLQPFHRGAVGELRLAQGNLPEACEFLRDAVSQQIAHNLNNVAALENLYLAEVYARMGDTDKAIDLTATSLRWFSVDPPTASCSDCSQPVAGLCLSRYSC